MGKFGGGSGKAKKNAQEASATQLDYNKQTAGLEANINRYNENNPYSSTAWSQDPKTGMWTVNQTATPQLQGAIDSSLNSQTAGNNATTGAINRVAGTIGTKFDTSGLPQAGGTPTADFNDAVYPIVTTNQGSITDRWTIIFTNTAAFRCIGELTGEISGGNTGVAYAPINPATGVPYFTIPALGWGSGWSSGNVYRFNTSGANAPLWLIRTVAPSVPGGSDSVTVEFRGYVNT